MSAPSKVHVTTHLLEVGQVCVHNSRDVGDILPKSRVRENPEMRFCEVAHNNLRTNTFIGGTL